LLLGRASASISQDTVINGYYHQQPLFLCQIYVVLFCIISHRFEKKLLLTGLTMLSSQRMWIWTRESTFPQSMTRNCRKA